MHCFYNSNVNLCDVTGMMRLGMRREVIPRWSISAIARLVNCEKIEPKMIGLVRCSKPSIILPQSAYLGHAGISYVVFFYSMSLESIWNVGKDIAGSK